MEYPVDSGGMRKLRMLRTRRVLGTMRAQRGLGTLVRVAAGLLRVLALDVDSRHKQGIPIAFYLLAAVSIALFIYAYHVSVYWFIITRGRSDLLFSIILFSLETSCLIGFIKLLYMYFNSKKLKELVSEYLKCDAAVVPDSRMSRNVLAALGRVRRRAIVFWCLIIGNGVVYVMQALLRPGRHLMDDKQMLLGLEPMFDSPNYEIAFVTEFFGVFITVYTPANITAFIIIIVGYTEAQMVALSQELLHLWKDAQQHYKKTINNDRMSNGASIQDANDFEKVPAATVLVKSSSIHSEKKIIVNSYIKQRLISIMKMHAINISLVNRVESLFQSAMAMEFALLSVSLIAELLGGLENTYIEVPYAMIQVSMDCITGQKLIDANKAFEEAVYECNWENFDVSNMKLVMVMLQNAQKTMKLSAGRIANLDYPTLMSVIRSIYSAYTTLRSTMNK